MKYKIKHAVGTGIMEDVGGDVSIDDVIDRFLQEDEDWKEAVWDDFYDFDSAWHEHGPTDVVDTLVLENGEERDLNISKIEDYTAKNITEMDSIGWDVFFSHTESHEDGEWDFASFELENEFKDKFLTAHRNGDSESIFSHYTYNNPDTGESFEIQGELLDASCSAVDITLYVNTRDGVVECDDFYEWREEMEEKGIDTSSKEEIKNYLIEKYNIDIDKYTK